MANQITYFNKDDFRLDYDRDTLGLLLDESEFIALDSPDFASTIATIKNFALHIDNGNCTFIKEFRKSGDRTVGYWYACKRTNGKLKKLYFGHEFTKDKLMHIVDRLTAQVTQDTQVTQVTQVTQDITTVATDDEVTIRDFKRIADTWQNSASLAWDKVKELKAELEALKLAAPVLAGNGKSDRHIQPSLMELANTPDKQLTHRCNELERQNKDLNRRLIDAIEKIEKRNQIIDTLEARNFELNEVTKNHHDHASRLERRFVALQKTLDERDGELLKTHQKLLKQGDDLQRCQGLKELHHEALERIYQLEWEASKREDDVQGYAYMYDEHSNKLFEYYALIEKYRAMTTDKNKKAHPRFAYLIDFLADIDKIS